MGANGELVTLEEQDRTRWDRAQIDEGLAILERALAHDAYLVALDLTANDVDRRYLQRRLRETD